MTVLLHFLFKKKKRKKDDMSVETAVTFPARARKVPNNKK